MVGWGAVVEELVLRSSTAFWGGGGGGGGGRLSLTLNAPHVIACYYLLQLKRSGGRHVPTSHGNKVGSLLLAPKAICEVADSNTFFFNIHHHNTSPGLDSFFAFLRGVATIKPPTSSIQFIHLHIMQVACANVFFPFSSILFGA